MEDRSQGQKGETSPLVLKIVKAVYQTLDDETGLVPFPEVLDLSPVVFDLNQEVPDLTREVFDRFLEALVLDWFLVERKVKEAEHWSGERAEEP